MIVRKTKHTEIQFIIKSKVTKNENGKKVHVKLVQSSETKKNENSH